MKKKKPKTSKAISLLIGVTSLAFLSLLLLLTLLKRNQDIRQQASEGVSLIPITIQHSPEIPNPGEVVTVDFLINTLGVNTDGVQLAFSVQTQGQAGTLELAEGIDLEAVYTEVVETDYGYDVSFRAIPNDEEWFTTIENTVFATFSYTPTVIETTVFSFDPVQTIIVEYNDPLEVNLVGELSDYLIVIGSEGSCQKKPSCLEDSPPCNIFYYPEEGWCDEQCVTLPECARPGANPTCDLAALPEGKTYCSPPLDHVSTCNPSQNEIDTSWGNSTNITNPYFSLPEGLVNTLEFEGESVRFTVTPETKVVNGVTTRVIEEYETADGELVEISYNYFAQAPDGTVCYFGENVDVYENNNIISHEGTWLAGEGENKAGIFMPALPEEGQHFRIEDAPGITIEEGTITSVGEAMITPAHLFTDTVSVKEEYTSEVSLKGYSKNTGFIRDNELLLTSSTSLSLPSACLGEGEYGYTEIFDGELPPACCVGLIETTVSEPHSIPEIGDQCIEAADAFVCTQCGDGICGPGENNCNCSSDCSYPSEPPSSVSYVASVSAQLATDESLITLFSSPPTGPFPYRILEIHPIKVLLNFGEQISNAISLSIDNSRLLFSENEEVVASLDLALSSKCAQQDGTSYDDVPFELQLDQNTLTVSASDSAYFPANYTYLLDYQLSEDISIDRKSYAFTTTAISPLATDITGDQIVDIDDYSVLAGELLTTDPNYFYADFDCNGIVDIDDYTIMTSDLFVDAPIELLE